MANTTNPNQNTNDRSYETMEYITNGQMMMYGGGNDSKIDSMTQAVGSYSVKDTRTEENTVYDVSRRVDKIIDMTAMIAGDYYKTKEQSSYQNIHWGSQQTRNDLSSLGIFDNTRQNQFAQSFAQHMNANGGSVVTPAFTEADYKNIIATGRTSINGHVYDFSSDAGMRKQAQAALTEMQQHRMISNAHGMEDQANAIAQMRHSALDYLHSDANVDVYRDLATGQMIVNDNLQYFTGSAKQIKELQNGNSFTYKDKKGNVRTATLTDTQATVARKFGTYFGGVENEGHNTHHSVYNRRHYAAQRTIARGLFGDDLYKGYETVHRMEQVAKLGVSTAYRASAGVGRSGVHAVDKFAHKFLSEVPIGRNGATLSGLTGSATELLDKRAAENKRLAAARKNGTYREEKINVRNTRKQRSLDRQARKEEQFQKRHAEGSTRRRLHDARKNTKGAINKGIERATSPFKRAGEWLRDKRHALNNSKIAKLINLPGSGLSAISEALGAAKAVLMKYVYIIGGGFLVAIVLINCAVSIVGIIATKFSSAELRDKASELLLEDMLNEVNYVQAVVDYTAEEMQLKFLDVAQNDVQVKANTIVDDGSFGAQESPKYDWYLEAGEADLGTFYEILYDEEGNKVGEQETDSISNLLQLASVMHYRYEDDLDYKHFYTMKGYMYYMYVQTHDVHSYEYQMTDGELDIEEHSDQALQDCTNIYYHGYDMTKAPLANKIRLKLKNLIDALEGLTDIDLYKDEEFLDEVPYDSKTSKGLNTCNHYHWVTHTGNASYLKCTLTEHTHGTGCNSSSCSHSCGTECCSLDHDHTAGGCNDGDCDHSHGSSCCSLTTHTHTDVYAYPSDENCYYVEGVCDGHCAGHITPVINLSVCRDWEAVAAQDTFKTVYFMSAADFNHNPLTDLWNSRSITAWKEGWQKQFETWFVPFPNSPVDFAAWFAHVSVDWYSAIQKAILETVLGGSIPTEEDAMVVDDVFQFKGWYGEDGNLNKSLMKDLRSFYGEKEDDFKFGEEMWEDFEVVFPAGNIRPITEKQKREILTYLVEQGKLADGSKRYKVISQGLDYVGKFTYDIKRPGNYKSTSGRIDCSGWMASVLYHAKLDPLWTKDCTASGFAEVGRSGTPATGDVLAISKTAYYDGTKWVGGDSNHVILWVGELKGVAGFQDGDYILDCSSSAGGSSLRPIGEAGGLSEYKYKCTSCY